MLQSFQEIFKCFESAVNSWEGRKIKNSLKVIVFSADWGNWLYSKKYIKTGIANAPVRSRAISSIFLRFKHGD